MRSIYWVAGADRLTFLQGMLCNDVRPLGKGPGLVYAALLTPQGKYLADMFVGAQGEGVFLDIDSSLARATIQRLSMYLLRADVLFGPANLSLTRGLGPAPAEAFADPRHPDLGWRFYGAQMDTPQTDWDALRVTHIIPESGIELVPNDSYILENGFDRLNGVSFRKGCYVGQEVTARMRHKTELKKALVRVVITGAAPVGTPIMAGDRVAGTLFTQSGGFALAHLRMDWAVGEMRAGDARITIP